jgi:flagellar biosynthesis protein FliR
MTIDVLPEVAFAYMLIFARVGTMLMLMPALGESTIPTRLRLVFALMLALILYPAVADSYPALPPSLPGILALFAGEILIGFFIGLISRMITGALQVAGSAIAFQMGLGFAQGVDPTQGIQGALMGSFLSMLGITLIFATDLHHLLIAAIHDSYRLFVPGAFLPVGDVVELAVITFAQTFRVGVQIAAPFIAFGLVFYLGLGVLSRLMPQIQIFFVAMPANIMLGLLMLLVLLTTVMAWFLDHVATSIGPFILQ